MTATSWHRSAEPGESQTSPIQAFTVQQIALTRRYFLASLASAAFLGSLGIASRDVFASSAASSERLSSMQARLSDLEIKAQGRLGVHILDTATGQEYGYRSDERFMMLSSFKLLASALVLHRVDAGHESLERRIPYSKEDLVTWSPVTEKHADGAGMTLAQLCEATITTSDNTAANLILSSYGGPAALTAYARQLGDTITRLDRFEPKLNVKHADGVMDTTSPRAMVGTMLKVVLGDALTLQSRNRLQQWLLSNTTGGQRLKAGLPTDWRVGDKTGTNQTDANDIGVIWPPKRAPVLVAVYLAESQANSQIKDATIAAVGRLVRDNMD
jgi:beta-lactamase class A